MAQLDLAPGAIVLLHHLCYASGNSEPGNAEPSVSVARQRADNYAAGFLKAGASAVIADGHAGAERYLRAIFTTHQSIEDMWRTMPNANGNFVSFPSARTSGATVYQDPNTPDLRVLPVADHRDPRRDDRRGRVRRLRRHRRRPDQPRRPRQRRRRDRRRVAVRRSRPAERADRRRCRPGRASASSSSRPRPPPSATRWSRSRAWTTRRSPATCSRPTWPPRTAPPRSSASSTRAGRSRPTAIRRMTRRRSAAASPNWSPGRCGSRPAAAACSTRRPGPARPSPSRGTARSAAIPSPTAPTRSA